MKALPKIVFALTGVAALSIAYPASVEAVPTTYTYTGNHFTQVSGPYNTSMFVTAMVTLAAPLGANMPLTEVTPIAFTLFDGVQTISSTNPDITTQFFFFATNARGEITLWDVTAQILGTLPHMGIDTHNGGNPHAPPHDFGFVGPTAGQNSRMPGVWSGRSVPDAGSTLSLMTLTLMALGVATRQFKRASA
jgi:hypothetical protein